MLRNLHIFPSQGFSKLLRITNPYTSLKKHSCLCGHVYLKKKRDTLLPIEYVKLYSTQSDQHRQKVVIDSTEPKIVISQDKLKERLSASPPKNVLASLSAFKAFADPYIQLARWDKPTGVYLLFWPCSWSIALSWCGGAPAAVALGASGLFLAGAGLMRGAGCTINDLWDRDIDRQVSRTRTRPLASGALSTLAGVSFLAAQLSLALGILLQLNCASVALGASSLALVITYPLAKRFTSYPQLYLGATFNWGALLGHCATTGALVPAVGALYTGAIAWTYVYDTIYAHQDKIDDARLKIGSSALGPLGGAGALVGAASISGTSLGVAGALAGLGPPYYVAVATGTGFLVHQILTLDINNPSDCGRKFKSTSWYGLIVLLGLIAGGAEAHRRNTNDKEEYTKHKSCVTTYFENT